MMRSENSVVPFLVPHCKVWLMPTARVLSSNAANIGECKTWMQSEFSTWLMAHWKARVEFLLSVIELLFLSLTDEALQGKMCHNSLPPGGVA